MSSSSAAVSANPRRLAGDARRGDGGRERGLGPRAGRRLGRDGGPRRRLEARGPRPDGAVRRPTARARVEEKEFALAWHYRQAEPDLAALRAQELSDQLIDLTETSELRVMQGHKVVEVGPAGTSKGTACQVFLSRAYDFVLGVGDDTTDEDLFRVLPPSAYSIRVGLTQSYARYNVADQAEALSLVEFLTVSPLNAP